MRWSWFHSLLIPLNFICGKLLAPPRSDDRESRKGMVLSWHDISKCFAIQNSFQNCKAKASVTSSQWKLIPLKLLARSWNNTAAHKVTSLPIARLSRSEMAKMIGKHVFFLLMLKYDLLEMKLRQCHAALSYLPILSLQLNFFISLEQSFRDPINRRQNDRPVFGLMTSKMVYTSNSFH